MKLYKFIPAMLIMAAVSFTSCSDTETEPDPNPQDEELTPEEIKEKVSDVALSLLDKFKPQDQKELVEMIDYLSNVYGDYELDDEVIRDYAPMRRLSRSNHPIIVAEHVNTGIYTASNGKWRRTANSSDAVIFRIPNDARYGRVELTVKYSGKMNGTVNIPDEGSYYVESPTNVDATLTTNGKTMLSENLYVKMDVNGQTLNATNTLSGANLKISTTVNATNSQAQVSTTGTVGSEQFVNASGTISGNRLCDINYIAQLADRGNIESLFSSINFNGNILGQLYCKGTVKALGDVANALDSDFEYGGWRDVSEAEASADCDKAINLLNRNISATWSFTNGGSTIASLTFIKDSDKDGYYDYNGQYIPRGEFYPIAALKFNDGTTYTDEYFEYGFDAVVYQWETLVRAYENLCR